MRDAHGVWSEEYMITDYSVFLFPRAVKRLRAMKNEASWSSTNCRLINIS
jgi:hypothetical protein